MKILMVLTSHDRLGDTGKPTGFWLEEFAAPYFAFRDAGAEVILASPGAASHRWTRRATSPTRKPKPPTASAPTSRPARPWPTPCRCPGWYRPTSTRCSTPAATALSGTWWTTPSPSA